MSVCSFMKACVVKGSDHLALLLVSSEGPEPCRRPLALETNTNQTSFSF